ncbi:MAG: protein-L-isoaspartate(D-aspartate) O-methyltransferase [Paludibacter sp.]
MIEIGYERLRQAMVEYQLKSRGIDDPAILDAFRIVCRHNFVPPEFRDRSYEDTPLPIGFDQTISQPYIVAYMLEKLELHRRTRVLEIGTGSGYQTAILSCLCAEVYSVEINAELAKRAREILARDRFRNVRVKVANGYDGWKAFSPYDRIIVSCAPYNIPVTLTEQLAEGGRMIIPAGLSHAQKLYLIEKRNGIIREAGLLPVRFVGMISKT